MRGVTSTVSIISAKENGERHAMTATSVTSLSLDPPAMLVCVNKDASIHNIINYGSSFCINILSSRQKELAEVCSKSEEGEARFEGQLGKRMITLFMRNSLYQISFVSALTLLNIQAIQYL